MNDEVLIEILDDTLYCEGECSYNDHSTYCPKYNLPELAQEIRTAFEAREGKSESSRIHDLELVLDRYKSEERTRIALLESLLDGENHRVLENDDGRRCCFLCREEWPCTQKRIKNASTPVVWVEAWT